MKPTLAYIIPFEGSGATRPDNELPAGEKPVDPGYGIPVPPPSVWPPLPPDASNKPIVLPPPIHTWPPLPIFPVGPDNTLPVEPGQIYPPLPPEIPEGLAVMLVYVSGVGYRWAVIKVPPQGVPK